jgi:tRNA(fMet)-specific endonuclease VapC
MLRFALDINFCIRVLRDRPHDLRPKFNANANAEALCLSDVVLYELLDGAERSSDPARIRRDVKHFVGRLIVMPFVMPFDSEGASHTAEIRADLERRGCVIGPL